MAAATSGRTRPSQDLPSQIELTVLGRIAILPSTQDLAIPSPRPSNAKRLIAAGSATVCKTDQLPLPTTPPPQTQAG